MSIEHTDESSLILLQGGNVYCPEFIGKADVLFGGTKILGIFPQNSSTIHDPSEWMFQVFPSIKTIDVSGMNVVPGFIDVHMHVTGGGGEKGPASRTPEARLDEIIDGGITTIVGLLGTDSVSRTLENLLVKLKGLEEEGLTTYMWTGAYGYPPPTLTESVQRDIVLIDKIIGVGELAISDQRSSNPTVQDLSQLVGNARVGGLLSKKAGIIYFHVGSGARKLDLLWEVLETTDIPITQMYPTHMSSRGQALLDEGIKWIQEGGFLDFTADGENDTTTFNAIIYYNQKNVPLKYVTMSSDAYGSFPVFDSKGKLIKYDYGRPSAILHTVRNLVLKAGWDIEKAISFCTSNPAKYLGFDNKGYLKVGNDADILVLDKDLKLQYVFSRGSTLKTPTHTKHAMFPCLQ